MQTERQRELANGNGSLRTSSYLAGHQKRQAWVQRSQTIPKHTSVSASLRGSHAVPVPKGEALIAAKHPAGGSSRGADSGRQSASAAGGSGVSTTEAALAELEQRLQQELHTYDKKLDLLRSHVGSLLPVPRPKSSKPAPMSQQTDAEPSIVKGVISATGQGCASILVPDAAARPVRGACWTTRPQKSAVAESSAMLQMAAARHEDACVRITFANAAAVPALVKFEHAPTATAAFQPLGEVRLHAKSMQQLKHVFRLGAAATVERCLRLILVGHISKQHAGVHQVSYLLVTGRVVKTRPPPPVGASFNGRLAKAGTAPPQGDTCARSSPLPPELELQVGGSALPEITRTASRAAAPEQPAAAAPSPVKRPPPPPPSLPAPSYQRGGENGVAAPGHPTVKWFWDKVQAQGEEGQLAAAHGEVDFAGLEQEFAAKAPAPKSPVKALANASARQQSVLPLHRVNTVGVLLARLRLSPPQARQALLWAVGERDPDHGGLPARPLAEDDIASLLQCLPTPGERQRLAAFTGPASALTPAEQFMLSVMDIPALQERLHSAIFMQQLDSRAGDLVASAGTLSVACREVRDSPLLRTILKTSLLIGNFLNAGNRNGSAAGFHINDLLKLRDVRSTRASSRTLLHFLARELARQQPNGASLRAELPHCTAAARVTLSELRSELDQLAAGLQAAQHAADSTHSHQDDVEGLLEAAAIVLGRVNVAVVEADAAFHELRSFLNGSQDPMDDPSSFFAAMSSFCDALDAAHAENAAADAAAAKHGSNGTSRRPARSTTSASVATDSNGGQVKGSKGTPPLQRRNRMLAAIRLYSRMTPQQREGLLTERGAEERLNVLGITHRHSIAEAPSKLQAPAASPGTASTSEASSDAGRAGVAPAPVQPAARARRAKAAPPVTASAPALRMSDFVVHAGARAGQDGTTSYSQDSASSRPTAAAGPVPALPEESAEGDEEVPATATQSQATDDWEGSLSSSTPASAAAAGAAVSSPVARALRQTRQLIKSLTSLPLDGTRQAAAGQPGAAQIPSPRELPATSFEDSPGWATSPEGALPSGDTASPSDSGDAWHDHQPVQQSPGAFVDQADQHHSLRTSVALRRSTSANGDSQASLPRVDLSASLAAMRRSGMALSPASTPLTTWSKRASQQGRSGSGLGDSLAPEEGQGVRMMGSLRDSWRTQDQNVEGAPFAPSPAVVLPVRQRAATEECVTPAINLPKASPGWSDTAFDGPRTGDHMLQQQSRWVQGEPQGWQERQHQRPASIWQSTGMLEADSEDDAVSVASSGDNPVCSAQLSPRDDELVLPQRHVPTGRHSMQGVAPQATASWGNLPFPHGQEFHPHHDNRPAGRQERRSQEGAAVAASERESQQRGILRCSTEWVQRASQQGGSLRSSKRVSFSLPNSPEDREEPRTAADCPQRQESQPGAAPRGSSGGGLDLTLATQLMAQAASVRDYRQQAQQQQEEEHTRSQAGYHHQASLGSAPAPHPAASTATMAAAQARAGEVLQRALASELRRSLPQLPGVSAGALPALPVTRAGLDLDAIMAAVIQHAGNTPTGPLARGVREGNHQLFDDKQAEVLRHDVEQRGRQRALLEPIVPAPLGMGVRASETVSHGISPNTLRHSLESTLRPLMRQAGEAQGHRLSHSLGSDHSRRSGSGPSVSGSIPSAGPLQSGTGSEAVTWHSHSSSEGAAWQRRSREVAPPPQLLRGSGSTAGTLRPPLESAATDSMRASHAAEQPQRYSHA